MKPMSMRIIGSYKAGYKIQILGGNSAVVLQSKWYPCELYANRAIMNLRSNGINLPIRISKTWGSK